MKLAAGEDGNNSGVTVVNIQSYSSPSSKQLSSVVYFSPDANDEDFDSDKVEEKRRILREPNNWSSDKEVLLKNVNLMSKMQDYILFRLLDLDPVKVVWDPEDPFCVATQRFIVSCYYTKALENVYYLKNAEIEGTDPVSGGDLLVEYCTFCPNLEYIFVSGEIDLKHYRNYTRFSQLDKLYSVSIHNFGSADENLSFLGEFPNLQELTLVNSGTGDSFIKHIESKCNINSLYVRQCPNISSCTLADFIVRNARIMNDVTLDVSVVCPCLTEAIWSCDKLEQLLLLFHNFKSPCQFKNLRNLKTLTYLRIRYNPDQYLKDLDPFCSISGNSLPSLKRLYIESSSVESHSRTSMQNYMKNFPLLREFTLIVLQKNSHLEDHLFLPLTHQKLIKYEILLVLQNELLGNSKTRVKENLSCKEKTKIFRCSDVLVSFRDVAVNEVDDEVRLKISLEKCGGDNLTSPVDVEEIAAFVRNAVNRLLLE